MLYVSAFGFVGRFIDLAGLPVEDFGRIVLTPLIVRMDVVTVFGDGPLRHTFNRGNDEFTIPLMSDQEYYKRYGRSRGGQVENFLLGVE